MPNETIDKLESELRNVVFTSDESPGRIEHMDIGCDGLFALFRRAYTLGRTSALDDAVGAIEDEYDQVLGTNRDDDANGLVAARMILKGLRDLKK